MIKKIGQRRTEQRENIYDIIKSAPGPLSVYDIFRIANEKKQTTSLATIYRTVKLLLENDKLSVINLSDGHPRYSIPSLEHHHHFHCKQCGIVIEIEHCCMHLHKNEVDGHIVDTHEITLVGTCKNCR